MTDEPDAERPSTDDRHESATSEPEVEAPETDSIRDDGEPLGANVA